MRIVCIGGGAASFFFAANVSKNHPKAKVIIIEQAKDVLQKVRISGGGRCNVTHHCFDPKRLIKNYPRGEEYLLGPFSRFGPKDTIDWFEKRGVPLKVEADGRMFPKSNSSQSIIQCFKQICQEDKIDIKYSTKVKNIKPRNEGRDGHIVETLQGKIIEADILFIGTGSNKAIWQTLEHLGHSIISPVPSLFTFQIKDTRFQGLSGITIDQVLVSIPGTKFTSDGPMLITHKGLSGPAILKLSARAARYFFEHDYTCQIKIDFRPDISEKTIKEWRDTEGKKLIGNTNLWALPKRLVQKLQHRSEVDWTRKIASVSKKDMAETIEILKGSKFEVLGQNRFKEEFVTAGGIDLQEVDFNRFASTKIHNMYFAGEVLNIDAVTGGFNFQSAWTGAYIAAQSI